MLQLLKCHAATDLPRELVTQIRAALLAQWPDPNIGEAEGLLIEAELHPTYFALTFEGQLRSYTRTIWSQVTYQDKSLKLYGLGDVITLPAFRRKGYASRLVQAATDHIQSDPEADAALLLTEPTLSRLYQRSGWEYVQGVIAKGEEQEVRDAFTMMLFLSEAARALRTSFAHHSLVLPGNEW